MSYSSYNVRGILCKSDTIAYTSNHKFLPLESQVYLKRTNCKQEHNNPDNSKHEHTRDHNHTHNSKHEHTRDHDNTHNSKHEHTRDHNHTHQMCPKC